MNATGYIINSILVLLVLRQIRVSRLDLISLVLPAASAPAGDDGRGIGVGTGREGAR